MSLSPKTSYSAGAAPESTVRRPLVGIASRDAVGRSAIKRYPDRRWQQDGEKCGLGTACDRYRRLFTTPARSVTTVPARNPS